MPKLDINPGDLIEIPWKSTALIFEADKPFVSKIDLNFKNCLVLEYLYKEIYGTGVYVHFLSVLYKHHKLDIILQSNPELKIKS